MTNNNNNNTSVYTFIRENKMFSLCKESIYDPPYCLHVTIKIFSVRREGRANSLLAPEEPEQL